MSGKPRCGLCGKNTFPLTKTECCNNWICDDECYYGLILGFQSCMRNHERYTLCHSHFAEGHMNQERDWRKCNRCKESFEAEDYVWYVTNEYNFNEPSIKYQMADCADCGRAINFSTEPHLSLGNNHFCLNCMLKPDKKSNPPKKTQPGLQPKPKSQNRQSSTQRSKSTGTKKPSKSITAGSSTSRFKAKSQSKEKKTKPKNVWIWTKSPRIPSSTPRTQTKSKSKSKTKKPKPKRVWMWAPSHMIQQTRKSPKKTGLLPTFGSRTASASKTQTKSKSKSKTTKPKSRGFWTWAPNNMIRSTGKSRGSSNSKKYGKRKASASPKPKPQAKKVKKNDQLNQSGKTIQLSTKDLTNTSSAIEIEKSSRGRSRGKKEQDSRERSSSGQTNTKKKVQWIKRT